MAKIRNFIQPGVLAKPSLKHSPVPSLCCHPCWGLLVWATSSNIDSLNPLPIQQSSIVGMGLGTVVTQLDFHCPPPPPPPSPIPIPIPIPILFSPL